MSKTGEYYLDLIEKLKAEKIAEAVGIDYSELIQTEYDFSENVSDNGATIHYLIIFDKSSPKQILKKIQDLHGSHTVVLSPFHDFEDDYLLQRFEFDAIRANTNYVNSFQSEIENLRLLNKLNTESKVLDSVLKKQLYISAITILETFLSETFINQTNENERYFKDAQVYYGQLTSDQSSGCRFCTRVRPPDTLRRNQPC